MKQVDHGGRRIDWLDHGPAGANAGVPGYSAFGSGIAKCLQHGTAKTHRRDDQVRVGHCGLRSRVNGSADEAPSQQNRRA